MKKQLVQIASLILLPCLVADPITASGFAGRLRPATPITIPARYGRITDCYSPEPRARSDQSWPLVVLIQDLHGNVGVQRNIAGILKHVAHQLNSSPPHGGGEGRVRGNPLLSPSPQSSPVKGEGSRSRHLAVFAEGAYGPFDVSILRNVEDRWVKKQAVEYFLHELKLTGPEIAAIESETQMHLWGVEDRALYLKNLQAFYQASFQSPTPHPKNPIWKRYYEIAKERDVPLTLNSLAHLDLLNETAAPPSLVAFVTGGYHSEGIAQILKMNRIPYVVVTPVVTSLGGEFRYTGILRNAAEMAREDALSAPIRLVAKRCLVPVLGLTFLLMDVPHALAQLEKMAPTPWIQGTVTHASMPSVVWIVAVILALQVLARVLPRRLTKALSAIARYSGILWIAALINPDQAILHLTQLSDFGLIFVVALSLLLLAWSARIAYARHDEDAPVAFSTGMLFVALHMLFISVALILAILTGPGALSDSSFFLSKVVVFAFPAAFLYHYLNGHASLGKLVTASAVTIVNYRLLENGTVGTIPYVMLITLLGTLVIAFVERERVAPRRILGIQTKMYPSALLLPLQIAPLFWHVLSQGGHALHHDLLTFSIYFYMTAALIFIHELAHAFMTQSRWIGMKIHELGITGFGGFVQPEGEAEEFVQHPWKDFLVSAAGPLINIVLGLAAWVLVGEISFHQWEEPSLLHAGGFAASLSLLLALTNLIPLFITDGGRMLRAALASTRLGYRKASWISAAISIGLLLLPPLALVGVLTHYLAPAPLFRFLFEPELSNGRMLLSMAVQNYVGLSFLVTMAGTGFFLWIALRETVRWVKRAIPQGFRWLRDKLSGRRESESAVANGLLRKRGGGRRLEESKMESALVPLPQPGDDFDTFLRSAYTYFQQYPWDQFSWKEFISRIQQWSQSILDPKIREHLAERGLTTEATDMGIWFQSLFAFHQIRESLSEPAKEWLKKNFAGVLGELPLQEIAPRFQDISLLIWWIARGLLAIPRERIQPYYPFGRFGMRYSLTGLRFDPVKEEWYLNYFVFSSRSNPPAALLVPVGHPEQSLFKGGPELNAVRVNLLEQTPHPWDGWNPERLRKYQAATSQEAALFDGGSVDDAYSLLIIGLIFMYRNGKWPRETPGEPGAGASSSGGRGNSDPVPPETPGNGQHNFMVHRELRSAA